MQKSQIIKNGFLFVAGVWCLHAYIFRQHGYRYVLAILAAMFRSDVFSGLFL